MKKKREDGRKTHYFFLFVSFSTKSLEEMGDFVDHELLLSVASGIGRWVDGPAGVVYERDEDCLGKREEEEGVFFLFLVSID